RHRPERVVVGDRDVAGVRDRRDLLGLEDAADVHDVRLQHADLALPQQRLEVVLGVAALAGGKACLDAAPDLGQRRHVLGVARLFEPVEAVRLELLGYRNRRGRAEAAVAVDQDLHLGPDCVAHRRNPLDRLTDQGVVGIAARALERVELEAAIALVPDRARRLADLRGAGARAVPGVGVGGQALVHAAAQELVHRAMECLAHDVPERDLDRADRAVQDRPAARELVAEHGLPQALDRERRLPDHVTLGELVDRRLDRLRLPFAGALADAGDAVVGEHACEHPVAPAGADQMGLDPGDAAVAGGGGHRRLHEVAAVLPGVFAGEIRGAVKRARRDATRAPAADRLHAFQPDALDGGASLAAIRVGMVGGGFMGRAYSLALSAVYGLAWPAAPEIRRVRLAEVSHRRGERAARAWGWDEVSDDWRAITRADDVDLVLVLTPNDSHAEISIDALAHGKHVLCENPLSNTLEGARAMYRAA